jgi:cell fate regulator YaaT (PSP1 superfamily)
MDSEMEDRYFVGVRYEGVGKSYYYSTHIGDLRVGDKVVVENISGLQIGIVSTALLPIESYSSHLDLKPVLRRPTPEDLQDYNSSIREAQQALEIAREEAANLGLQMKFLTSSFSLDGSKVTITYTADGRVDFRELLRLLAPQLRCRIELHQIASRDKAKMIGGMGICGLPLCCATFLNSFDGISISRAKNQMLTLNIPKLSGACGKLICCLSYEDDLYTEAKRDFPRIGTVIHQNGVDYTVETYNVMARSVKLSNAEGYEFISLDDFNAMAKKAAATNGAKGPNA